MFKKLAKSSLKAAVRRLPWGGREAVFEALCERMGEGDILARCIPRLDNVQLCASGSYGLVQSALNDGLILPYYSRHGDYEPRMASLFGRFFSYHGGGTYLDIGANIGLTTIPVARDPSVKCLAFEPDPVNSRHLRANIDRNCPKQNVTVYEVALFSECTTLSLSLNGSTNLGGHHLSVPHHDHGRTVMVQAVALDQFLDQLTGAVAAKIDAEGAEPFVVAGGGEVLSRAELVVLEFSPHHLHALGGDTGVVLEFLAGFERIGIGSNRGNDLPMFHPAAEAVLKLESLLRDWRSGDLRYCDVFATRGYPI